MSFKKTLIAVDNSEFSAHAADIGIGLAKSLKAKVAFIHVFDPSVGPGTTWGVPADRLMEMSEREAKRLLAKFQQRLATRSLAPNSLSWASPLPRSSMRPRNGPLT